MSNLSSTAEPKADIAPSLDPLVAMMADDMVRVNATILERMASDVPLIPQLAGHLIAAGGKRMRPLLTLAGAHLGAQNVAQSGTQSGAVAHLGAQNVAQSGTQSGSVSLADAIAPAIKLATAVEFIHSATLLHDDVIDQSDLRRGRDTANALWGNDASVLVGDFLFARAFELMVETGNINVLGRLSAAAANITEGEIKQMAVTGEPATPLADYLDVITGKTAILFAAAAAAGAEVAGGSDDDITAMHSYGLNLGMGFQIMDDALDYTADAADMGKNSGDDFVDQKITLPVILAWQDGSADEREFWQRTLGNGDISDGDLATAQGILAKHDAIDRSLETAADYVNAAIAVLAPYQSPDSQNQDNPSLDLANALAGAAAFAAKRAS